MEKNKSKHLAVCIICGVLTAFGIVSSIIALINGSDGLLVRKITNVINILLSVLILYYAFCGYRHPNGNLLKYIILLFAVPMLMSVYSFSLRGLAGQGVIRAVIIGLICYVAGRLHRVKQNMILMGIVTVLTLIFTVSTFANGSSTIGVFNALIIWLDICVAYILRYKEHKLAGLMDRVKN